MASLGRQNIETAPNHIEIPNHTNGMEPKPRKVTDEENNTDYSQRAQWLRAAVLGANDGLVSVASLMMGVAAVKEDITAMLLAGFAVAIGEFVSVYTQLDIEVAQMKRERQALNNNGVGVEEEPQKEKLPNPFQTALASALAFSVGTVVPLLTAVFIRNHKIRLAVVAVVASLALAAFGWVGAVLAKTVVRRSCVRLLLGGWMGMAITFGLTKLIGFTGL